MIDSSQLLEKARDGFNTLDIGRQYVDSALENLEEWLTDEMFSSYATQIAYLINSGKWDFLLDSFYQVIPFGTGGRRGPVGIGPNRINLWTIKASAQGHSQYLYKQYGEEAKRRGIVISYDVREYIQKGVYNDTIDNPVMNLNCKQLAIACAEVYTANGIKVLMFDGVRSTPELSFAIRHLKAISGIMISASHNQPTDNGKKVYDEFGGQLIPPDDQNLVNEVTKNVQEIKTMDLGVSEENGLIEYIGKEVDEAFWNTVSSLSLSQERELKILYSPLHGTGLTSVHPILEQMNFDVVLDPKTSNLSGAFENVTFNIPNPEVRESFDTSLSAAEEVNADVIISTDPDADRIGIMVKHNGSWMFLNGNEIGIILTQYGISKYRDKNILSEDCIVIKTGVTNSLIEKITKENSIQCIPDLLVGFKYIGAEMNRMEKSGKMQKFILGTEESHGFIVGNYSRDKDAACAAVWLSELAAELKRDSKTLMDYLDEIYSQYGYCHNYLTEIRLTGAKGMEQIALIMDHLRKNDVGSLSDFVVNEKVDRWDGEPFLSPTDKASRNVILFNLDSTPDTQSIRIIVRPSGTEPKVKVYIEVVGKPCNLDTLQSEREKISAIRESIEKTFMRYCYKILDVDFPERGFLLFWQLPLDVKIKYFEIEDDIVALKSISDKGEREERLEKLFEFLGSDPIEKVDKAFSNKFGAGIREYLGVS
ncbi:phosphomannomutase [Candidatus Scalindua japonica]|uniref:Phosphomannomutase n=1 Tax=Candidatus Scalindua japonica TaxID=1284222 RepID=A0A286TWF8_9BACT|nr:phospho-sugar mutase [Candidatus Scalindua japonica]GAX60205.1 phosphomannomutase [Candidatus Scalindua japonica]